MGTFRVPVEIGNSSGERYERVEALADTGATYTSVPGSLLQRLGVERRDRATFIQADGTTFERDVGQTWARVDGRSVITLVVFGDEAAPALLGAYTLEGVRLAVDPVNRRLVPVPGFMVSSWPTS